MGKINHKIFVLLGMALFVLSFINNAQAYKLHIILACDEKARGIGPSVMADYQNMKDFFESGFSDNLLDIVPLKTRNLTPKSIYAAIESMDVKSSDTILFYYSGHGDYDYDHGTQILALNKGDISRMDLLKKLRKKHAKLLIVLSDCCNVILEKTDEEPDPGFVRPIQAIGLEKLFMETSGELDITSSRINESSFCNTAGGYFTKLFIQFLRKNATNKDVEWSDLQKQLQPELTKMFKAYLDKEGLPYIDLKKVGIDVPPGMPAIQDDQRMYVYACPNMPIRFGAGVKRVDGQLKVVKVLSDTPAEKAGVEAGDILLEINGSPLKTYSDYDLLINYSHQRMRLKVKKSNGDVEDLNVVLAYE